MGALTEAAWAIVRTHPQAEDVAERSLRQVGYRAYLPRYRKLLLPHGRDRRPATALRPLFVGIVFAQDWRGWPQHTVSGTNGLFRVAGTTAKLSHADIEIMQRKERQCEFDDIKRPPSGGVVIRDDIAIGDDCEVEMFGVRVMAVLDELSDDGKAVLRATILGREVRTEVDADAIHPVSA
jgi:hypothetical protein